MDLSVSELKGAQNSTENVQRWITACITSRYRFVGTGLICPGLLAVNIIMSLVTPDSHLDPADTGLLGCNSVQQ